MKIQSAFALTALTASITSAALLASPAFADNGQQSKMTMCNQQAGAKKGDERKAFMKACLSASSPMAAVKPMTQQEKMKACNTQAGDKKGDERKAFMKDCLSNKG